MLSRVAVEGERVSQRRLERAGSAVDVTDREVTFRIEGPGALDLLSVGIAREVGRLEVGRGARTVDPAELKQVTPDVEAKTRRVLVEECVALNPFSPSPDGKRVAVRVTRPDRRLPLGGKGAEMLVVDDRGEVLARFDVFTSLLDYGEE